MEKVIPTIGQVDRGTLKGGKSGTKWGGGDHSRGLNLGGENAHGRKIEPMPQEKKVLPYRRCFRPHLYVQVRQKGVQKMTSEVHDTHEFKEKH